MHYTLAPAQPHQAADIATLIMLAMNHDCCRHFAGPHHTLTEFHELMTCLVRRTDSQYSYRHTLVALTDDGTVAGICVSYEGKDLRRLRRAFVAAALAAFGRDFSAMPDETGPGELYIDSLAVDPRFQGQGIASALLRTVIGRHAATQPVGLLVDAGNPSAERLYTRLGFRQVGNAMWGGHPMKHLQCLAHA